MKSKINTCLQYIICVLTFYLVLIWMIKDLSKSNPGNEEDLQSGISLNNHPPTQNKDNKDYNNSYHNVHNKTVSDKTIIITKYSPERRFGFHLGDSLHPKFLENYKNPCWYEECKARGVMKLRCMPYFFLTGFDSHATSELYEAMISHDLIHGGHVRESHFWAEKRHEAGHNYLETYLQGLSPAVRGIDRCITALGRDKAASGDKHCEMTKTELTAGNEIGTEEVKNNQHYQHPGVILDSSSDTLLFTPEWNRLTHLYNLNDKDFKVEQNSAFLQNLMKSPELLYSVDPDAKFVVVVRDPLTRLYDMYNNEKQSVQREKSPSDFHRKVTLAIRWLNKCMMAYFVNDPVRQNQSGVIGGVPLNLKYSKNDIKPSGDVSYDKCLFWSPSVSTGMETVLTQLQIGIYWSTLKEWFRYFSFNNFKLVKVEDLEKDSKSVISEVLQFLELPVTEDIVSRPYRKESSGKVVTPMLKSTEALLYQFYQPYNKAFANMMRDRTLLYEKAAKLVHRK